MSTPALLQLPARTRDTPCYTCDGGVRGVKGVRGSAVWQASMFHGRILILSTCVPH